MSGCHTCTLLLDTPDSDSVPVYTRQLYATDRLCGLMLGEL